MQVTYHMDLSHLIEKKISYRKLLKYKTNHFRFTYLIRIEVLDFLNIKLRPINKLTLHTEIAP